MTLTQEILTIAAVVAGTMATRFLPFLLFPEGRQPPAFVRYLGTVLPSAVIGLLVVFCLKDAVFTSWHGLPEVIGILFVGVMTVKYGDSLIPDSLIETIPQGAVLALSLLATFACLCVGIFQRGVVRLAGAVTLSQPFVSQLMLLKRTYFTLGVIVTVPALLLFALCPRGTGDVWFCIIVIELIVTAILYLREVLNLFISKKVSILHWILYLCIVEVFPVSLLWLLVAR